jgi:mono/diheme cytochrome c family protein
MDAYTNAILGIVFVTLGFAAVFLMFKIWGYPFDEERHVSSAPLSLVIIHRLVGVSYVGLYLMLMVQMVPRIFQYQVEFSARTVAHLMLGVTIGLLLILKLSIIRYFKHFSAVIPYLGCGLLWCTTMVVSLSVPFAFKESYWSQGAVGGSAFSEQNLQRLKKLIPTAGFPEAAPLAELSEEAQLRTGRQVLLTQCVSCHDLKTILIRPRTPGDWVRTVQRMADRQIFDPIEEPEQWAVSAYLIAISPELQNSAKARRVEQMRAAESAQAVRVALVTRAGAQPERDMEAAAMVFEESCTMCHELDEVEQYPLQSKQDIADLLERMVENGLEVTEEDSETIVWYMAQRYVD